jgi:hypothetical protein
MKDAILVMLSIAFAIETIFLMATNSANETLLALNDDLFTQLETCILK